MAWSSFFFRTMEPKGPLTAMLAMPLIGLWLGLTGPFGSYLSMGTPARIAHFCFCVTAIGSMLMASMAFVAQRYFGGKLPIWTALALDITLALPAALIVSGSLFVLAPDVLLKVSFTERLVQTLILNLLFRCVFVALTFAREKLLAPRKTVIFNPLADRLPYALRTAKVLALCAEDHYLRVHTSAGDALIHMRIAEAEQAMGSGFRLHRSHWVAEGAVKDEKGGEVTLINGLKLPVARQRRKALNDWLGESAHA